jgi:serine/threonine-protein kinase
MGRVFRALDLQAEREVAVKVLPVRFQETDTWHESNLNRLEYEGWVGRHLQRVDGTPVVYHRGVHEGQSYVVMELIPGPTLDDFLTRNRPLKLRTAVAVACQLGEILDALHGQGFVHRDVKPDNIKIDPAGRVHLLDLGIAKDITGENVFQGTRGYAPYEQVRDHTLTFQSDIYALGCLICEMVSNHLPFSEDDEWNVGDEPAAVPSHVIRRLRPDLASIVLRMIDRDLNRRFATMADAVGRLRRLLPAPDAPLDPQAPDPDPEEWLRRNPPRLPAIDD